jgi:SAM-dependent methyltransferase
LKPVFQTVLDLAMSKKLKSILFFKGVFYFLTRYAGSVLRSFSFDQYYKSGRWDYLDNDHSGEMVKVVERYANKGRILDVGCGPGILAGLLNPGSFEYYQGVDASSEAIAMARKRVSEKINFDVGDIQSYECEDDFDLIIFEESLYYVPFFRYRLLKRYGRRLSPDGMFIVTVADPKRFRRMIGMIRKKFQIIEDRYFNNSNRWLLVFR